MRRFARPAAVFLASMGVSLGVLHLAEDGERVGQAPMVAAASTHGASYALPELDLLRATLDRARTQYVEPGRLDPDRMFAASLSAIERLVPEAVFRRDGDRLTVRLGAYRGTLVLREFHSLDDVETQLEEVAELIVRHLPEEVVPQLDDAHDAYAAIEYAMTNGALETLDPHSVLLPPAESREMDMDNRGEFGGLGMTLQMEDHERLIVQDVMPGTPADAQGLRRGDHIRRIDGETTLNLTIDEAVELLRGHVGEPVLLEILRAEGETREALDKRLVRESIKPNRVVGHALGAGIGYVRLRSFHVNVATELREALDDLGARQALRGLVVDLRDNPGGYLDKAVEVADTFLDHGEIVSTRGPLTSGPTTKRAHDDGSADEHVPIVVLTNAHSASASEIVAGALRNNERAVIVGERSFGKGSVQNLLSLGHDSKLKLTIAHYLTPGERSIQSVGIPADIELLPTRVGPREDVADGRAALYERDRVRREADLDEHLEARDARFEEPLYQLRYLAPWVEEHSAYASPDPDTDTELAFAVELLRRSPSAHRPEMLAAAAPLVRRMAGEQEAVIVDAMAEHGIDWRDGPSVGDADLDVTLGLGEGAWLEAGTTQEVTLSVTNQGTEAVHRLVAVVDEHEVLGGREFVFGFVAPGQTVSARQQVRVRAGYPDEIGRSVVSLRDVGGEVAEVELRVPVRGRALPELQWSWNVVSPEDDGQIDVGDIVTVGFEVYNAGAGATGQATARIRNRSGTALDIIEGTLEIGDSLAEDGSPCAVIEPGWEAGRIVGDVSADHPKVLGRIAPRYADDCTRVLAPNQRWSGSFAVEVLEHRSDGYDLILTLADAEAYDHASVVRGGFYDYGRQEDAITFGLGADGARSTPRVPPHVAVRNDPVFEVDGDLLTISGRATDDSGIEHVVVFVDGDKVFFQGGRDATPVRSVPFTASVRLARGLNTFSVLVQDTDGYVATASHVVYRTGTDSAEVLAGR